MKIAQNLCDINWQKKVFHVGRRNWNATFNGSSNDKVKYQQRLDETFIILQFNMHRKIEAIC